MANRVLKKKREQLNAMHKVYTRQQPHFLDLAKYILPRKYEWLGQKDTGLEAPSHNKEESRFIKDITATLAVRTLTAGMMGGITSPGRPWFKLRRRVSAQQQGTESADVQIYLDQVQEIILSVLARSNFYTTLATNYIDLVVFGSGAFLIYPDAEDVIRCQSSPMGEFRIAQNARREVTTFGRTFNMTVEQVVERFGIDRVQLSTRTAYNQGGAQRLGYVVVNNLIEQNKLEDEEAQAEGFTYREFWWEHDAKDDSEFLEIAAYTEKPFFVPRWEVEGNSVYGTSPAMDALPDIIQLQHEVVRKAQSLDKMINPPVQADVAVKNLSGAPSLAPNKIIYVPGQSRIGVSPIHTVNPPLQYMTADIQQLQGAIRKAFYNDLFDMISQLQTVRSATEIDARQEEKLVLLGPVLTRFQSDVLAPVIQRVVSIAGASGILPEAPQDLQQVEIEYVSILAEAQKAIGVGSIERLMQLVGHFGPLFPELIKSVDGHEMFREYAEQLSVPPAIIKTKEQVEEEIEQERQLAVSAQEAAVSKDLAAAGKNAAEVQAIAGPLG